MKMNFLIFLNNDRRLIMINYIKYNGYKEVFENAINEYDISIKIG